MHLGALLRKSQFDNPVLMERLDRCCQILSILHFSCGSQNTAPCAPVRLISIFASARELCVSGMGQWRNLREPVRGGGGGMQLSRSVVKAVHGCATMSCPQDDNASYGQKNAINVEDLTATLDCILWKQCKGGPVCCTVFTPSGTLKCRSAWSLRGSNPLQGRAHHSNLKAACWCT